MSAVAAEYHVQDALMDAAQRFPEGRDAAADVIEYLIGQGYTEDTARTAAERLPEW